MLLHFVHKTNRPATFRLFGSTTRGAHISSSAKTATDSGNFLVKTWTIRRSADYGSPHLDERDRPVTAATLSADGTTITLAIEGFESTRCYSLTWDIDAADGTDVKGAINGTLQ